LLPWYINRTLEEYEQQQVESHLQSCFQCKREFLNLRQLSAVINQSSDLGIAAEVSFADLRAKMPSKPISGQNPNLARNSNAGSLTKSKLVATGASKHSVYWFRQLLASHSTQRNYLAIAASLFLVLSPIAVLSWMSTSTNQYYTLSADKPVASGQSKLHVVFAPSLTEAGIDSLLAQIHARRIEGPNSVGAYTVLMDNVEESQKLTDAIAFLRQQQVVMLAEPIIQP
jgi:hypothetical protein